MLPYFEIRSVMLGLARVPVQPFLASLGILLAHWLYLRRARQWGLDPGIAGWLSLTMVASGLAGAFLFRWAYLPAVLARDPWIWLKTTSGAASFGGIAAGLLAAAIYLRWRGIRGPQALTYLDALASVFPLGWIFGRTGCSLIHDHPGLRSDSFLAVRYPEFPRWDLAVVEVLFLAVFVIPVFAVLNRGRRPPGFFLGAFLALYGLFRLWLDTLHVDPPRYLGFTVDQLAYGVTALAGLGLLAAMLGRKPAQTVSAGQYVLTGGSLR